MPNRIISESIWASESLAELSIGANMFWYRLMPLPDDHGCFDSRVKILRGKMFPLMMDKVRDSDIEKWIKELEDQNCIRLWVAEDGKRYGYIPKWGEYQRIRSMHNRKTPEPPEEITTNKTMLAVNCRQVTSSAANGGLNLNLNLNPNLNPNKPVVHSSSEPDTLFESFWDLYKPLNNQSKSIAKKKFRSTVKTKAELSRCLGALERYKAQVANDRTRDDGYNRQYQMASTWLNQWQDWEGREIPDDKPDWIAQLEGKTSNDLKRTMDTSG